MGKTGSLRMYANQIAFWQALPGKTEKSRLRRWAKPKWWVSTACGRCRAYRWRLFSGRSQTIRRPSGKIPAEIPGCGGTGYAKIQNSTSILEVRMAGMDADAEGKPGSTSGHIVTRRISVRRPARRRPAVLQEAGCAAGGDTGDCRIKERKVQFTYTDVMGQTVGIPPPENGVIERARAGIDEAISREQLIPPIVRRGCSHQEFMCSMSCPSGTQS